MLALERGSKPCNTWRTNATNGLIPIAVFGTLALPKSLALRCPLRTLSVAEDDADNSFVLNWSALADDFRTLLLDTSGFELAISADRRP